MSDTLDPAIWRASGYTRSRELLARTLTDIYKFAAATRKPATLKSCGLRVIFQDFLEIFGDFLAGFRDFK